MMRVRDLERTELRRRLRASGLRVGFGNLTLNIRTELDGFPDLLRRLYGPFPLAEGAFDDFRVGLRSGRGMRSWWRPQVRFWTDGRAPFPPSPRAHALPVLEWGFNWCIYKHVQNFLMLHCAVLERHGKALVLPALPQSGKTTLCAALVARGWRLLSDEFGMVRPQDTRLVPIPRLMPLKNDSIDLIRDFWPQAVLGPRIHGTRKGTLSHLQPPQDSVDRAHVPADPRFIVFPHFQTGKTLRLRALPKTRAFVKLAGNSFNYAQMGTRGFLTARALVEKCDCLTMVHSDLERTAMALEELVDGNGLRAGA